MRQRLPEIIYKPEHLSHEGSRPNKVPAAAPCKKKPAEKTAG
tara:strand:- start:1781 stop:1906 length:126 start_codon:yes stop_codon:yes gene_type:complete